MSPFITPIISPATRDLWKVAEAGEIGQLIELLARGADVNASNQAGVTALMLAAYHGRLEMVRALTDHGADVNAIDKDGYSAAMLAQHSHREDIVRLLVARGARIIPKRSQAGAPRAILTKDPTSRSLQLPDAAEKRILEAPPNIWDVVHETHIDFNPRSAFFGHLKSINPHLFALIALIVGGGVVLGFIWFRGSSDNAPAASGVKAESTNNQVMPSSPVAAPDNAGSPSDQQSASQTTAPAGTESSSPPPSTITTGAARLASSALNQKIAAQTNKEPAKRVVAKPVPQPIPTPVGGVILSGTDKTDNSDKTQTSSTPAAKPDIKKSVEPTSENKNSEKTSTPVQETRPRVHPTPNN